MSSCKGLELNSEALIYTVSKENYQQIYKLKAKRETIAGKKHLEKKNILKS